MTPTHSRECLRHRLGSRWVGGYSSSGHGAGKGHYVLMVTRMFLNLQNDILCYLVHIQALVSPIYYSTG